MKPRPPNTLFVDTAAPPKPHPHLNIEIERFTRMPIVSQLHPCLRGIKPSTVKRTFGEVKDFVWRTGIRGEHGMHERDFHTAGVVVISSKGMWLCKRKYNGNAVWSDVFARRATGDEPAWETATRALFSHAYLNANPANGRNHGTVILGH